MFLRYRWVLLISFIFLVAVEAEDTRLEIKEAWIPEAPPGVSAMAGYMRLLNTGTEVLLITGASSPDFAHVHLHATIQDGDLMRMVALEKIEVAAGELVELVPNGKHLMLRNPVQQPRSGDTVQVVFKTNRGDIAVEFKVLSAR